LGLCSPLLVDLTSQTLAETCLEATAADRRLCGRISKPVGPLHWLCRNQRAACHLTNL
jgi:hypothetical protein